MTDHAVDKVFAGSIPEFYDTFLVPLIFEQYARQLARRLAEVPVSRVLEIAAGTGVVTRAIHDAVEPESTIVATDLNSAMIEFAAASFGAANIEYREADALALPFEDGSFDVVACQFGVMFFPDRAKAYSEALRVLRPGGRLIFNVWDHIRENEFADTVTRSLVEQFPEDPPRFLARTPHGYFDVAEIASDLTRGGFATAPEVETVAARSRASDPSIPAIAYCQGTPLRNEIETRGGSLQQATEIAANAVADRFGNGEVDGQIQGHVISIKA